MEERDELSILSFHSKLYITNNIQNHLQLKQK